jgi:hypothetical protein
MERVYVAGYNIPTSPGDIGGYVPPYYDMVDQGFAAFHGFGSEYEEFENGVGNATVAIVEFPDGTVRTVLPNAIRFIEPSIASPDGGGL